MDTTFKRIAKEDQQMRSWLADAWTVLRSALGPRQYTLPSLVLGGVALFAGGYFLVTGKDVTLVAKIAFAMALLLTVLCLALFHYSVGHLRKARPKIKLDFDSEAGCVVESPMGLLDSEGRVRARTTSSYLKVKVTSVGLLAAKDCEAFLAGVQKRKDDGTYESVPFHDTLDLPWSLRGERGFQPLTIGKGTRRYFDVLYVRADKLKVTVAAAA